MDTLAALTRRILNITDETTADDLADIRTQLDGIKAAVREADSMLQAEMIGWIDKNGDLKIGDMCYYVGTKKRVKCKDNAATIDLLLSSTGGDMDEVASFMASQPWKYAKCRDALGDQYDECFEEIVDADVKTGKPKKTVKTADKNFVKGTKKDA